MRIASFMLTVVAMTICGCQRANQVSSDWRQQQQRLLLENAAKLKAPDRDVSLNVSQVVSLDERTFLLGGSYRTSAGSIRSALLRSTDGGDTWHDTGVWLVGCDTQSIFVLDQQHAFAMVNWSIEGSLPPYSIFRTSDGGATWQRSEQDLPLESIGIPLEASCAFASPLHGQFRITGSMGTTQYYLTTDGGRTWKLSHIAQGVPGDDLGNCRIDRDWKNKRVHIQYCSPVDGKYKPLSTIPTRYTIDSQAEIAPKTVDDNAQ